jgi:hypothetical protein
MPYQKEKILPEQFFCEIYQNIELDIVFVSLIAR